MWNSLHDAHFCSKIKKKIEIKNQCCLDYKDMKASRNTF